MILNNIILIVVLLLLANYLSKGTIITIVLKYYEIVKNNIFPFSKKEKEENTCDFNYDNEPEEKEETTETDNTLKLNTLNLSPSDSGSITISDMNFSTLVLH
jgi:hypothetical protein